jgi:ribosomal protein S18 acetylase RimI-like enzyme
MTPEEFRLFLDRSVPDYARSHVQAGRWKESEAVDRSRAEYAQLLPQGIDTPDNFLRTVQDERGARVGEVWFALRKQEGWPLMFVYWIGIDEAHRRKGYASEVLRVVEGEAKRLGAPRVALHVFGDNVAARALYEKLGYATTNVIMAKPV